MTRPIPTTPEEVADAISLMIDFYSGAAAGTNVRIDWSALNDGVREFLRMNLTGSVPAVIAKEFEDQYAAECFVEQFPDLVARIQSNSFELGTLGHLLAELMQDAALNHQKNTAPRDSEGGRQQIILERQKKWWEVWK